MKDTKIQSIKLPLHEITKDMIVYKDVFDPTGKMIVKKGYRIQSPSKVQRILATFNIQVIEVEYTQMGMNPVIEEFINEPNAFVVPDTQDLSIIHHLDEQTQLLKDMLPSIQNQLEVYLSKILQGIHINEEKFLDLVEENLKIFQLNTSIFQLMEVIRSQNNSLYMYCYQIGLTSYMIGKWLGLNPSDLKHLYLAALLSNIGKIKISKDLLFKKDLSIQQKSTLQKHVVYSYDMVCKYNFIKDCIKEGILYHHEKINRCGYPFQLESDSIPLYSKIIGIADEYISLLTQHDSSLTPLDAIHFLERNCYDKLDPHILYTFTHHIGHYFIGQKILLTNDELGQIVFFSKNNTTKPLIRLLYENEFLDLTAHPDIKIKKFVM